MGANLGSLKRSAAAALTATFACAPVLATPGDTRPNVVVILADDLGYADVSFNGNGRIPTPHIDAIANNGVKMTNAYVTCPVCGPSRASIMTGVYNQRFGFYDNWDNLDENVRQIYGIPHAAQTLAERLRGAGYVTGLFGKWHLGYVDGQLPNDRGFDAFWGFLGNQNNGVPGQKTATPYLDNRMETQLTDYQSFEFANQATRFIRENAKSRFFTFLSLGAVHTPIEPKPEYLEQFASWEYRRRRLAAVAVMMDDAVGRVTSTLASLNLLDNTIIVFLNDNGGSSAAISATDNGPLSGYKYMLSEGGIRVPFAMSWPRRIAPATVYHQPVSSLDVVPTVMAAVGNPIPTDATDGANLLPYVRKTSPIKGKPHEALYWFFEDQKAIRLNDYKWVYGWSTPPKDADGGVPTFYEGLFNVRKDPGEKVNLLDTMADKVKWMKRLWGQWYATLPPELW